MPTDAPSVDARRRLGEYVRRRRLALKLSLQAAADAAQIARQTWTGIETANRETESYIYGRVEEVLDWTTGSFEAILAGGEPEIASPPPVADVADATLVAEWEARLIAEIKAQPLPKERKDDLIQRVRDAAVKFRALEIEREALEYSVRQVSRRRSA